MNDCSPFPAGRQAAPTYPPKPSTPQLVRTLRQVAPFVRPPAAAVRFAREPARCFRSLANSTTGNCDYEHSTFAFKIHECEITRGAVRGRSKWAE